MKRSRHTADVCRPHGISSATFYSWKAKYGGLSVSEAKRLRALESENARLKKPFFADAMLDNAMLKDLLSKKMVTPAVKREAVVHLRSAFEVSEAAGVFDDRGVAHDRPLSLAAAGRF